MILNVSPVVGEDASEPQIDDDFVSNNVKPTRSLCYHKNVNYKCKLNKCKLNVNYKLRFSIARRDYESCRIGVLVVVVRCH